MPGKACQPIQLALVICYWGGAKNSNSDLHPSSGSGVGSSRLVGLELSRVFLGSVGVYGRVGKIPIGRAGQQIQLLVICGGLQDSKCGGAH